jgi:hypothetical protein
MNQVLAGMGGIDQQGLSLLQQQVTGLFPIPFCAYSLVRIIVLFDAAIKVPVCLTTNRMPISSHYH